MCKIGWLIKLKLMSNITGFHGNPVPNTLKDINEQPGLFKLEFEEDEFLGL